MKLRVKIILIFLFISLVPLLVTTVIYYRAAKTTLIEQEFDHLESVSQIQKNRLETINQRNIELIDLLASRVSLKEACKAFLQGDDKQKAQEVMNNNLRKALPAIKDFKTILLLDMNGIVIAGTDSAAQGTNLSRSEAFIKGKKATSTDIFYLDSDSKLNMSIAAPYMADGKQLGVILIKADASDITDIVNDYTGLGETGETVLGRLNENGDAIFLTPLRKDSTAALKRILKKERRAPLNMTLETGEELRLVNSDYVNDNVFASTRYLPGTGWAIVSKIDIQEALAPLSSIRNSAIAITLTAIAILLVLALYFSSTITNPILKLTEASQNIIRGTPQPELIIRSRDEIGILAQAFNVMVEKLDLINKAGEALSSSLDHKVILQRVSRLIVPRMADWFIIDVLENGKIEMLSLMHRDPTKIELAKEYRKKFPRDPSEPAGAANVMRTGKAEYAAYVTNEQLKAVARNEEHYQMLVELGFCSAMIIPLAIKDKVIGCITMVTTNESGKHYTEADLHLAEDLARRISITLDNSRLYHQARELNEKKDEFMSIASHELKTPLTSAKAFIQLAETTVNDPAAPALQYIRRSANAIDKLQGLISELLDVSRLQSGKLEFHFTEFDLNILVDEVISNIQNTIPTHTITRTGAAAHPVKADRDRMEQVLINLLTNATKYSPGANKVIVNITQLDKEVQVSVSDFGIGIPKENLAKIFNRYYRVETGGVRFQGLGIGLYIAYEITRRHKGRMWAESEEGKGSTFYFMLPVKRR